MTENERMARNKRVTHIVMIVILTLLLLAQRFAREPG